MQGNELDPPGRKSGNHGLIGRLIATVAVIGVVIVGATLAAPLLEPYWRGLRESGDWRHWAVAAGAVLLFLAGPLLMLRRLWRKPPAPAETGFGTDGGPEALPRRVRGKTAVWGCVVGPAVFLVVGLGFSLFFAFPAVKVIKARSWDPVECEILASSVATHTGDDGSTYSVEVTYRYQVEGLEYTGNRYRFLGGSSSGREGKQEVVDSLPPGTTTTCWVDPESPDEAVLDRNLSWEYAFALLPLVFVGLGALGLVIALRARALARRADISTEESFEAAVASLGGPQKDDVLPAVPPGELLLEPAASPFGKLLGVIFFALIWNGILSIFVWQFTREPEWFLGCFLVPFVLVGLLLLTGIPYQLLALANPRPHLRLADGRLRPGGATNLHWHFTGATGRLRALSIRLEGRETVTYRSGDSSSSSSTAIARVDLVDRDQQGLLGQGNVLVEIPPGAMHSFNGRRNKIEWVLVLQGKIARWPDVNEEFEVAVLPEVGS